MDRMLPVAIIAPVTPPTILIPTGFDNNYAAAEPAKWT